MAISYTIGIDLGGTKLRIGAVDASATISVQESVATDVQGGSSAIVQQIAALVRQIIEQKKAPPFAIGIGLPGQVDASEGVVLFAPNLAWHNVPIKKELEYALGLPVHLSNDVRAATYGEWQAGQGRGYNDLVSLFVGTGIGGGIVSMGKLMTGSTNAAGEFGHMIIEMNGRSCTCGQKGCLEAYASGWAIAQIAQNQISQQRNAQSLLALVDGNPAAITARIVAEAYKRGDPIAQKIIQEALSALITGGINIANILNPRLLILGGGVIDGLPELVEPIQGGIIKGALKAASAGLTILPAALGADAGLVGAALFAREPK